MIAIPILGIRFLLPVNRLHLQNAVSSYTCTVMTMMIKNRCLPEPVLLSFYDHHLVALLAILANILPALSFFLHFSLFLFIRSGVGSP